MSKKRGLNLEKIIALIKEKDITVKQLSTLCNIKPHGITATVCYLRHRLGYDQIITKYENRKRIYHWLTEQDDLDLNLDTINSRTKKAMIQVKFSNNTNIKVAQLTNRNQKIMKAIQQSQIEKGEQALLK